MEIGSIFEIDLKDFFKEKSNNFNLPMMQNNKNKYQSFFNTGRSAIEFTLRYLSSQNPGMKILLPDFNCSSVTDAVKRSNVDYDFYAINEDFQINLESLKKKLDTNVKVIYIIQFFGTYQSRESSDLLKKLQTEGIIIIEDVSHALYSNHEDFIGFGDYIIGSIRKWLPIPDGAILLSKEEINKEFVKEGYNKYVFNYFTAQVMKSEYLNNESLDKNKYLKLNSKAMDSLFSDFTIRGITDLSMNYLLSYDMDEVMKIRKENYVYLYEKTKHINFLKTAVTIEDGQVPFGFIIMTKYRDELLNYLISNKVYCNVHWDISEQSQKVSKEVKKISNSILTIPCDQRYGKLEMDYIVTLLEEFNKLIK